MRQLVYLIVGLIGILGGCAHVMSEAGLARADRSIPYGEISKSPEAFVGKTVLVGGIIAANRGSGDVLQLEVAQLELFANGVPDELSHSSGRFLLVSGELLDPLFYPVGSLVTVIGEIKGQKVQKLDGADYRYPLVSAKEIRVFRASDPSSGRPSNPYQNQVGDDKFLLRPPGILESEPRKPY